MSSRRPKEKKHKRKDKDQGKDGEDKHIGTVEGNRRRLAELEARKTAEAEAMYEAEAKARRNAIKAERDALAKDAAWVAHTAAYFACRAARKFAAAAEKAVGEAEVTAARLAERQARREAEEREIARLALIERRKEIERNRLVRVAEEKVKEADRQRKLVLAKAMPVRMHVSRRCAFATRNEHWQMTLLQGYVRGNAVRREVGRQRLLKELTGGLSLWQLVAVMRIQGKLRAILSQRRLQKKREERELLQRASDSSKRVILSLQARYRGDVVRRRLARAAAKLGVNRLLGEAAEEGALKQARKMLGRRAELESCCHLPQWVMSTFDVPPRPSEYRRRAQAYGASPFFLACAAGNLDLVHFLLREGADVEAVALGHFGGATPLWVACEQGHDEVVHFLCEQGEANVRACAKGGVTPFWISCQEGHVGVVRYLLDREGVDPEATDARGATPFFAACEAGRVEVVQLLVEEREMGDCDFDHEVRVDSGEWPYLAACRGFHYALAAWLFENRLNGGALHPHEAQFLDELFWLTDGEHWNNNSGWDDRMSKPEGCFGVKIDEKQHLCAITLSGNNLRGTIPELIGHCKHLEVVRLDFNQLIGMVPSSIGGDAVCLGCKELRILGLAGNQIEGQLPKTLLRCHKLQKLFLANNPFIEDINQVQLMFKAHFLGKLTLVM